MTRGTGDGERVTGNGAEGPRSEERGPRENSSDLTPHASGHKPLASVIIVARDEEENLGRCLAGVRSQQVSFDYEIVVVDSGSRDRTAEVARSFGARVIGIGRDEFQHGRTRQMASEAAAGEYLVYLVADAVPADEHWLSALVDAVAEDERVAGAYSRQVPREGAGPLESLRLTHRLSSGLAREVREIGPEEDFWSRSAEDRFRRCEFDDVSCCRRRSVVERVPIPAVEWAEDLLWARAALLAGHRIVFEPGSAVRHSHEDTVRHAFRRGWLDQRVVKRWFGVIYFDSVRALLFGYPRMYLNQARAIMSSGAAAVEKAGLLCWNLARLGAEMAGNFVASREERRFHTVYDLAEIMTGHGLMPKARWGLVLSTRFTLGADNRKVLFMNPDAGAVCEVFIPAGARLEFGAAINPAARRMRKGPVWFGVVVDREVVWSREIGPGQRGEEPVWTEASIDLSRWAGRRVRVGLVTRSADTDYAWAGWGAPRIVVDELFWFDRIVNWVLEFLRDIAAGRPLRHP